MYCSCYLIAGDHRYHRYQMLLEKHQRYWRSLGI